MENGIKNKRKYRSAAIVRSNNPVMGVELWKKTYMYKNLSLEKINYTQSEATLILDFKLH